MTTSKDTAERKVQRVKIRLMRDPKFALWQGILMVGKTSVVDNVRTACTNGRDEMYGRALVQELNDKELAFVILHENLHKAFRHLTTWQKLWKEDSRLANQAMDYVINLMLVDMDPGEGTIAMARGPLGQPRWWLDRRFKGMHTKQVYDILKQEKKDGGGDGDGDGGLDDHDWEGARELSEEEKKELEREIDSALRNGEALHKKLHGTGAGNMNREIGELLRPQVDWREALRDFVKTSCANKDESSWRRPNRRMIGDGVYMPSLIGTTVGEGIVGCDTSGSIEEELKRFIAEMKVIAEEIKPEKLHVLYWDSHVAAHEIYGDGHLPLDTLSANTKPLGGGGTTPSCVTQYIANHKMKPEFVIMFTDGEVGNNWGGDWGGVPVLWVVCNKYRADRIVAPNGKTIHID